MHNSIAWNPLRIHGMCKKQPPSIGERLLVKYKSLLIIHYHWVLSCAQYPMIKPLLSA